MVFVIWHDIIVDIVIFTIIMFLNANDMQMHNDVVVMYSLVNML